MVHFDSFIKAEPDQLVWFICLAAYQLFMGYLMLEFD